MNETNRPPKTRPVTIGGFDHVEAVTVGGDAPVVVQTMWKDRLVKTELDLVAGRIAKLRRAGCRVLRFAVPDIEAAETLGLLAQAVSMPLVADVHFDYRIALRCMDFPVAKIRINPGNIGSRDKVRRVLEKAAGKGIPIRIGVNSGSLPADLRPRGGEGAATVAEAMVEAAERELALFDEFGFDRVLVSMKAGEIADTVRANRIFSGRSNVPLHVGVTEAGPLVPGLVRSTAALVPLLAEGIGDTVRVSLSDSAENEVIAATEICRAAAEVAALYGGKADRLRREGARITSCPRCGRHGFDTHAFIDRWLARLYAIRQPITVAVMGCEVNGPVEAANADIGITGMGNRVLIFRHGKPVRKTGLEDADAAFAEVLAEVLGEQPPA